MLAKKQLQFAALVRVSTEKQEKLGESLRTQRTENTAAVRHHGGAIVGWYGGQEHATPGHEKREIDRLLADAEAGRFDAVIVANADRWSRDNAKSQAGLEVFKACRVRFFVGTTEHDLFNPEHFMFLGMSAVIGQFQAQHQNRKSILNRIERAKRGLPVCGKLPFGRLWDKAKREWSVDPVKQQMIEDVARRYLSGEPLPKLAAEYGVNHSNLHKTLTQRCGPTWHQEFRSDDLNIRATVPTAIPALLPDDIIRAVLERVRGNKTYCHGQTKHQYLFGRMIFCARCGYTMFGQTNHNGKSYYRHAHTPRQRSCDAPSGWVDAGELDSVVMRHLIQMFGNPLAIQRSIEDANPNAGKADELRGQLRRVGRDLERVQKARANLVRAVANGTLRDDEAAAEMNSVREREVRLNEESARLHTTLEQFPDPDAVKGRARRMASALARAELDYEFMSWEDKRGLAQMVFSGKTSDGRRMGVYVEPAEQGTRRQRCWNYTVRGHLVDSGGYFPLPTTDPEELDNYAFGFAYDDVIAGGRDRTDKLLEVTRSASRSPGTGPPGCRSCAPPPRPVG